MQWLMILILLYVDDILITGPNTEEMKRFVSAKFLL